MIGEQLNSSSWRHRVMACKVIPKLYGHVNKVGILTCDTPINNNR